MKEKNHLPFCGVGPLIGGFQVVLTTVGVVLSAYGCFDFGKINLLNIPLKCLG